MNRAHTIADIEIPSTQMEHEEVNLSAEAEEAEDQQATWMHSSTRVGRSVTDLGVVVRWSRVKFCFYTRGGAGGAGAGQQRSTGWVMDEYEITDPGCYRRRDEEGEEDEYWVLCRVRKSKRPVPEAAKPASPPARQRWRKLAKLETDSGVKAKVSRPLRT